ncbi:hypothetical protein GH714_029266 [Hevea brasiliensis]|uniref:Protein kinase domain-containing protein n=1 Tax=Hevea brasiliensis TaxID=3981 RepID=A0A6A6N8V8_HEVBR|nr:hypothetical protein GH714_029266 [Hevea brasiliensis]
MANDMSEYALANGVSERKLAHLVSMSLSWLHDKNLPRELWVKVVQCACYVINHLPPWLGKEKSPFEFVYDEKPKVNYFRKRVEVYGSRKKKYVTSRDVLFDEVLSYYSVQKTTIQEVTLDGDQENLQLCPENNMEVPIDDEFLASNISNSEDGEQRRSTRERRQPKEREQCVVHRDIKSSNIMLDSNFNAKLGDFGLARMMEHGKGLQMTVLAGTMGYMAPECLRTGKASRESDVYSFGVVALEIACGRRPINSMANEEEVQMVSWVWELYGRGKLLEAADPRLCGDFDKQEMKKLMIVGLWCVHPDKI